MKRVIVDYEKLTADILELLVEKYPEGYFYEDIISFQNSKGETVKAVEVRTEETIFLVKISAKLDKAMDDYIEDESSFEDTNSDEFSDDPNFNF